MIVNSTKIQVSMSHKANIMVNRYNGGELSPISLNVDFSICSLNDNSELVHNKVSRILYFIDYVLDNSIILTPDDSEEFSLLVAATHNNLIFCPDSPTDEVLCLLLYSKINSMLGENKIYLGDISIVSSDNKLSVTYDSSAYLANTSKTFSSFMHLDELDYCQGYKSVHLLPWWDRDDGFTYELILPEGDERDISDFYKDDDIKDPLSEFPDYIDENKDEHEPKSDAMIIKLGTNEN